MEIFRVALLLLLQLSPTFVHINGEVVPEYTCTTKQTSDVTVSSATAKLTEGCVLDGTAGSIRITFDLDAMYKAAASKTTNNPKTPVTIDITDAVFIRSDLILSNADSIPEDGTPRPLQFTMIKTKINQKGRIYLSLGDEDKTFKLPPESRIRITESKMTISDTGISESTLFSFRSLELVGESSVEIADNEITMECEKCNTMAVFDLQRKSPMTISGKSSFTIRNNNITMKGHTNDDGFTWQYVWYQDSTSPLTISDNSNFKWLMNRISMDGDNVKDMTQVVWYTASPITISTQSHFLSESNIILLLAKDYKTIESYVMMLEGMSDGITPTGTISGGSSMKWRDNCVGMAHTKAGKSQAQGEKDALNKKHMFAGKWSITDKGSELQVDGNYITTTEKYGPNNSGLTQLVWDTIRATDISKEGILTIQNTKVYSNNAADGATGMLWSSPLYTSDTSAKQPDMTWSSSPAKDGKGSPIPTLDNSNIKDYMCVALPGIPSVVPDPKPSKPEVVKPTKPAKGKSATAILSTTPGVLITSAVFLYLYNW